MGMIVGIVGSRHWYDRMSFALLMRQLLPSEVTEIISGGAPGVDTMAREYAEEHGICVRVFSADAEQGSFVKRAHARNRKIADASDFLIALPSRHSKGTYATVRRFEKRGAEAIIREVSCCWTPLTDSSFGPKM